MEGGVIHIGGSSCGLEKTTVDRSAAQELSTPVVADLENQRKEVEWLAQRQGHVQVQRNGFKAIQASSKTQGRGECTSTSRRKPFETR